MTAGRNSKCAGQAVTACMMRTCSIWLVSHWHCTLPVRMVSGCAWPRYACVACLLLVQLHEAAAAQMRQAAGGRATHPSASVMAEAATPPPSKPPSALSSASCLPPLRGQTPHTRAPPPVHRPELSPALRHALESTSAWRLAVGGAVLGHKRSR